MVSLKRFILCQILTVAVIFSLADSFLTCGSFNKKQIVSSHRYSRPYRVHAAALEIPPIDSSLSRLHQPSPSARTIIQYTYSTIQKLPYWSNIVKFIVDAVSNIPSLITEMSLIIPPADLLFFGLVIMTYKSFLRLLHSGQKILWKLMSFGSPPYEWDKSVIGFIAERVGLLLKMIGFNYGCALSVTILRQCGFRIEPQLQPLFAKVIYIIYTTNVIDLFKSKFLYTYWPSLGENRRQSYVINRASTVLIWTIGSLVACEVVSTYLKVPLSSTLAFGGLSGIALGFSARDMVANLLGGILLLFNEPFTPGDMVTFNTGKTEFLGRVERVGWTQTRVRGRDTRPTYIPNAHFVQTPVTNMDRITHRKFETIVPIRFQDHKVVSNVVNKIKDGIKNVAKLDMLSQQYLVHFIRVGAYSLDIEVTCYFATKSMEEFLSLQQMANLEIIKAVHECGAELAVPAANYQIVFDNESMNRNSSKIMC